MYTFPFTKESVQAELCQRLVAYRNEYPTTKYSRKAIFRMFEDGTITGHPNWSAWEVEDGILYILDARGQRSYRIDSLETANGVVYPMGESLREAKSAFSKFVISPVIHPTKMFRVAISSHKDYYETTVPYLLKSLKRVGLAANAHVAVADITKRWQPLAALPAAFDGLNITMNQVKLDRYGYTALLDIPLDDDTPYWLLLHDTCEVTQEFGEKIMETDFGLHPDYILLGEGLEIGFYSTEFIKKVRSTIKTQTPAHIGRDIETHANKWIAGRPLEVLPEKDVYGTGNKRLVRKLEVGIKKFSQGKASGAKL
jgi:hypothetical protein